MVIGAPGVPAELMAMDGAVNSPALISEIAPSATAFANHWRTVRRTYIGSWQKLQSMLTFFAWWHFMQPPIVILPSRDNSSRSATLPWHSSHVLPAARCLRWLKST